MTTVGVVLLIRLAIAVTSVTVGAVLSIFETVASVDPVFQSSSMNSNVKPPFAVNVYAVDPLLFVTVIGREAPVRVAITSTFVAPVSEYSMLAVGVVLSISTLELSVVAVTASPAFPVRSENWIIKAGVRFPVAVTVPFADQFIQFPDIVIGASLFTPLIVAVTPVRDSLPENERVILSPSRASAPLKELSDSM